MDKRVVIVGGGFGGLQAAKALGASDRVLVTVLDKKNHHLFQPLLYQVATASLAPSDIGMPIRHVLAAYGNVEVHLENVASIDLTGKRVVGDAHSHGYDYLILACGATHSYFGHEEWEEFAPGLKTAEQALEIRRRILTALEEAEKITDMRKQERLLTFVIIGGGPTGVELAGAVAELARSMVRSDFRNIAERPIRVILIQGGDRILPAFDPVLSRRAQQALVEKGVTVLLNHRAEAVTAEGVRASGQFIPAGTMIWAAGVKPSPLNPTLGVSLDREGRVPVGPDLSLPGHPEVFVIGDQARCDCPGGPLPGLAPVAMQQGRATAANILRDMAGRPRKPFRYVDKGVMAVIGRAYAVVQFHGLKFSGLFAWLTWIFVHIAYLIGHRNKLVVLVNWAWSYATFRPGSSLITARAWKDGGKEKL
jgi:NADH dehydrogenase